MRVLAVIICFFGILMQGGWIVARYGRVATALDAAGSSIIPYVPWISLVIYIAAVILIRKDKKLWRRWAYFAAVTVLCNTIIGYPMWIYMRSVNRIKLASEPSKELRLAFESHFQVKTYWYSDSKDGEVLAVNNADYSEDMKFYIKKAEQDAAVQPLTVQ